MSRIRANQFTDKAGTGAPTFPNGVQITGVATATTLSVSGNATITGNTIISGNLQVDGTQTIINTTSLEVEDINVGIASTATKLTNSQLNGAGITIYGSQGDKTLTWDNSNSRMAFSTDLYSPRYYGDGSQLTGVSVGLATESVTASAGIVTTLNLSKQDHKVTATGITTITCSGGVEGESHTVRITNSGIATVGFSTYFLFPSGSSPVLPTTSGAVSLISFTVHRVGTAGIGTQLLAGASLNFS